MSFYLWDFIGCILVIAFIFFFSYGTADNTDARMLALYFSCLFSIPVIAFGLLIAVLKWLF